MGHRCPAEWCACGARSDLIVEVTPTEGLTPPARQFVRMCERCAAAVGQVAVAAVPKPELPRRQWGNVEFHVLGGFCLFTGTVAFPSTRELPCFTDSDMLERDDRQRRFLEAYAVRPAIAPAARLAGVHRATIYRWQADPKFATAMQTAAAAFDKAARAKLMAEEAERKRLKLQRELARRPMRCENLAKARAKKRQQAEETARAVQFLQALKKGILQ